MGLIFLTWHFDLITNLHVDEHSIGNLTSNFTCSSCGAIYGFIKKLLLRLNVTTPCCLGNITACEMFVDPEIETFGRTDPAKGMTFD